MLKDIVDKNHTKNFLFCRIFMHDPYRIYNIIFKSHLDKNIKVENYFLKT